jgi:hypothetical protein
MVDALASAGITIRSESYCTSGRSDSRLFGVLDLSIPGVSEPDFGMAIGLRASNDKSLAIQAVAGAQIYVCTNLVMAGDSGVVVLRRKHTSRLNLAEVVPRAIDAYLQKAGQLRLDISRMKACELDDGTAKAVIHDAFARKVPILPDHRFREVARLYFDDPDQRDKFPARSLWSLNNAFTEAVKALKPAPQAQAHISVGRYFGRVLHRLGRRDPIA